MASESDNIFDGVEDAPDDETANLNPSTGGEMQELSMPGLLRMGIRAWLSHLTYREVHAVVLGFVPWALAIGLQDSRLLAVGLVVLGGAVGLHRTGNAALRTVVKEPWYAAGGAFVGVLAGGLWTIAAALVGVVL